jgi:transposase
MNIEYYIGLDIHAKTTSICILNAHGKMVKEETIKGPWSHLFKRLDQIKKPFAICYEASNGYGYLYDHFSKRSACVTVAHPGQLRLIFRSKRKSDRIDARKLAKLLFLDEVPPVYVPSVSVRDWRGLVTTRQKIVGHCTRCKSQIRALLRSHGIEAAKGLWAKKGIAFLKGVIWPSEESSFRCQLLLDEMDYHKHHLKKLESWLNRIGKEHPAVILLMSIPGVGIRTAEAMVAWIDQPQRFNKRGALAAYFGLVPCQDSSAGKHRYGHITKQGPAVVRQLLTQATWQAIYRCPQIKTHWLRIQKGDPNRRKIALVATSHHLLKVMGAMLKNQTKWQAKQAA